tara:strand:- start:161 stop:964 length:804 start_codon:yes stop_codon:yes gene_type:complete
MAIDLEAIRRKLNNLQTSTKRTENLWKPKPGSNQVRIVPYQHDKDNPFLELFFHYDLGKKNYLSPVTYGEADPVVEFADKLKSTGNSDDWKLSKKLEPKMRVYVPVVVRGEESDGVKFWGFGKQVYTELLGFIADPDYGDITDLSAGRDIVVEFTPSEGAGSYPKTAIRVKPNQTAATEDKNLANSIVTGQSEIFSIFKKQSYDDLKQALESWLNPDGESTDAPSDLPWETNTPKKAETNNQNKEAENKEKATSTDDISKAFDDLFS